MDDAQSVRIGISGWRYPPWRGVFYPEGLRQHDELAYASRRLSAIEINGTFYSLQRPAYFAAWAAETPESFVFAVKAPRYITHILRLRDARAPLANFLASGLFELGSKLGPILWQLPPSFPYERERIEAFLAQLPHDTDAAAQLAAAHDSKVEGRCTLEAGPNRPLRHALEVRHPSFETAEVSGLLRAHDVALVCADSPAWPRFTEPTAGFVYCRLHGPEELYAGGYDDAALDSWAERVRGWSATGLAVFVFFDNDAKVRAPFDAQALARRLGVIPQE
ncbi:MAG TPA: DUF72 domain-containing protein [Magnetospirillum sp.]|jgi:uncharacterized protein YecE (DUF72 family)|nr:DUF72 domain-containing protein [Magnetospirillum sp.]